MPFLKLVFIFLILFAPSVLYAQSEAEEAAAPDSTNSFSSDPNEDVRLWKTYYYWKWMTSEENPLGKDMKFHRAEPESLYLLREFYRVTFDKEKNVRIHESFEEFGRILYKKVYTEKGQLISEEHFIRINGRLPKLQLPMEADYLPLGWNTFYQPEKNLVVRRELYDTPGHIRIQEIYQNEVIQTIFHHTSYGSFREDYSHEWVTHQRLEDDIMPFLQQEEETVTTPRLIQVGLYLQESNELIWKRTYQYDTEGNLVQVNQVVFAEEPLPRYILNLTYHDMELQNIHDGLKLDN